MLKRINKKTVLIVTVIVLGVLAGLLLYTAGRAAFNRYFERRGEKLIELEKQGLLSSDFGAAWKNEIATERMRETAAKISGADEESDKEGVRVVNGIMVDDFPSINIIRRMNEVDKYSNRIRIADCRDRDIAVIKTDHTRADYEDFPEVLVQALIASEDSEFFTNPRGFEYESFVRAGIRAVVESMKTFSLVKPKGTSTITQQVAKYLISKLDKYGRRYVHTTVERKVRELTLASAIRQEYSPEEIMEFYINNCITNDYGLIGAKDIAEGLFDKDIGDLSDAECVYIARMVKWGRNYPDKIYRQARIDMERIGVRLGWSGAERERVLKNIKDLEFHKPERIKTDHGPLVDLANQYWLNFLEKRAGLENPEKKMDILDPSSLIRRKGNVTISLSIDLDLQNAVESLVDARGFGGDTTIMNDVRVGSFGEYVEMNTKPVDTVRRKSVLKRDTVFSEQGKDLSTELEKGDTLITNIRYRKADGENRYRRSCYYYTRKGMSVNGQYFSYCILDSKTGKLLVYYSRDRLGSNLGALMKNRVPNGSSTAKPWFYALNFDLGNYSPIQKWDDRQPVEEDVPWKRRMDYRNGKPVGVIFENSAVPGRGYVVHNHGDVFEGNRYIFEQLNKSNNILGVESVYRLNTRLFDEHGNIESDAFQTSRLLYRIGALDRLRDKGFQYVTGVRIYKEIARVTGAEVDSIGMRGNMRPLSDSAYSVGLGTLELTVYEQAHLFNAFHNNTMIFNPKESISLFADKIIIDGTAIDLSERDTVRRCHPFSDKQEIRPALLGLHKRLVSNPYDRLNKYDMEYSHKEPDTAERDSFSTQAFRHTGPFYNFAKSGTTDDILLPFNADITSDRRTNYGHWNAVIRIDMGKLGKKRERDLRDITIACVGECNREYTGARDGKSLHKYLSKGLLKKAGIKVGSGYYSEYEKYLRSFEEKEQESSGVADTSDTE